MIDIVFPNKNEKEFIKIAKDLGIKELIFVYSNKKEFYGDESEIKIENVLLVKPNQIQNTKKITICNASREAIERSANIVYGFEELEEKQHTHHRSSGMNQVLCKIAAQKKVRIAFPFSTILSNKGAKRAILIGKMAQNIVMCKKYKTPMLIASFAKDPYQMRAKQDLEAFFQQIGMTETKNHFLTSINLLQ